MIENRKKKKNDETKVQDDLTLETIKQAHIQNKVENKTHDIQLMK